MQAGSYSKISLNVEYALAREPPQTSLYPHEPQNPSRLLESLNLCKILLFWYIFTGKGMCIQGTETTYYCHYYRHN